jgi:hypothetical protein
VSTSQGCFCRRTVCLHNQRPVSWRHVIPWPRRPHGAGHRFQIVLWPRYATLQQPPAREREVCGRRDRTGATAQSAAAHVDEVAEFELWGALDPDVRRRIRPEVLRVETRVWKCVSATAQGMQHDVIRVTDPEDGVRALDLDTCARDRNRPKTFSLKIAYNRRTLCRNHRKCRCLARDWLAP